MAKEENLKEEVLKEEVLKEEDLKENLSSKSQFFIPFLGIKNNNDHLR